MSLIQQLIAYNEKENLFTLEHGILAAVSGGIDSMVMLDILNKLGVKIVIAHCNFGLRGEESDGDEQLVRERARQLNIECVTKRFNLLEKKAGELESIQMAAREARYQWFQSLLETRGLDRVAIAHNLDDSIETFFINLTRGTGIKGLTGIKPMNKNVIRPLLFASRSEIEQHARDNDIAYREDSSNSGTKYLRNKIRHQVIPLLDSISPGFKYLMRDNLAHLTSAEKVYSRGIEEQTRGIITKHSRHIEIDIAALRAVDQAETVLFEILYPFGFRWSRVQDIMRSLDAQPGKQFFSSTSIAIKDRKSIFVSTRETSDLLVKYYIEENTMSINNPIELEFQWRSRATNPEIPRESAVACIDRSKISFPLIIRKWREGDYFRPLGMSGLKKVSDFLIDQKVPRLIKQDIWVLTSGEKIVWIIGMRLDERFKITSSTREILQVIAKNIPG